MREAYRLESAPGRLAIRRSRRDLSEGTILYAAAAALVQALLERVSGGSLPASAACMGLAAAVFVWSYGGAWASVLLGFRLELEGGTELGGAVEARGLGLRALGGPYRFRLRLDDGRDIRLGGFADLDECLGLAEEAAEALGLPLDVG